MFLHATGLVLTIIYALSVLCHAQGTASVKFRLYPANGSAYGFQIHSIEKNKSVSSSETANEQTETVELTMRSKRTKGDSVTGFDASIDRIVLKQYVNDGTDQKLLTMDTRDSLVNFGSDAIEFSDRFKKLHGIHYESSFARSGALVRSNLDSIFAIVAGTRYDLPVDNAALFVVFPDRELAIGERWNNTVVRTLDGLLLSTTNKYTLKSVTGPTAEIGVEQTLTASGEGGSISGNGTGTYIVDITTGITIRANMNAHLDLKIKDGDTEIPMSVTRELTIASAKKKK
jgi:hypothetical protein